MKDEPFLSVSFVIVSSCSVKTKQSAALENLELNRKLVDPEHVQESPTPAVAHLKLKETREKNSKFLRGKNNRWVGWSKVQRSGVRFQPWSLLPDQPEGWWWWSGVVCLKITI